MKINRERLHPLAPHQAMILLKAEIMERKPDGKMTGLPAASTSDIKTFYGKNFEECKKQVQDFLDKVKEL